MQSSRARLLPTFPTLVRKRKRSFAGLGGGLLYRRPGDSSATLEGTGKMKEAVGWHVLITGPIKEPDEALAFVNECVGFRTS